MIKYALINFIRNQAAVANVFGNLSPSTPGDSYVCVVGNGGPEDDKNFSEQGTESGLTSADFEISAFSNGNTRNGEIEAAELAEQVAAALRNYVGPMIDPASPNIRHRVAAVRVAQASEFFDDEAELYECSFFITITYQRG